MTSYYARVWNATIILPLSHCSNYTMFRDLLALYSVEQVLFKISTSIEAKSTFSSVQLQHDLFINVLSHT